MKGDFLTNVYTGAIQIQHFGSALNAHLHFHLVYIDGVFDRQGHFHPLKGPTPGDLDSITHQIAQRVSRYLVSYATACRL